MTYEETINAEKYHNELMTGTYSEQVDRDITANVKAAKKLIRVLVVGLCLFGMMHVLSGCDNNSNPIQGVVCSTQSSPSVVCPK